MWWRFEVNDGARVKSLSHLRTEDTFLPLPLYPLQGESLSFDPEVSGPKGRMNPSPSFDRLRTVSKVEP